MYTQFSRFRRPRWREATLSAVVWLGLLAGQPALAAPSLYGEVQLGANGVRLAGIDAYPAFASVSVGAFLWEGIGVEAFFDRGLSPNEDLGFDLQLQEASGVALRLQSPPSDGLSAYVLLGYVEFIVEQERVDVIDARLVDEEFTGPRVSIGLAQRLKSVPALMVTAEYRHYYVDEPIKVDGFGIGLRVNIP